jgi:uncharacterized membrane protein YeiB
MNLFISGAIMMGYAVAGLFFLRFWRETRDRLFSIFALAFWVLAINRFAFLFIDEASEARTYVYLMRLVAFSLILVALIDKNRSKKNQEIPIPKQSVMGD